MHKWELSGYNWYIVRCTVWSSNANSTCRKAKQQFPHANVFGCAGVSGKKTGNEIN